MKRIYLVMITLIASAATAFAQSDLQITTTWTLRQGGNNLLVTGNSANYPGKDTFRYTFKNFGPNDIAATDTIWIKTNYGAIYAIGSTIKKDSTKMYYNTVNLVPGSGTTVSSTIPNQQRCDSIWVKRPQGTTGVLVADPVMSNNKVCNTFVTTYWLTSVNDAYNTNAVSLYPNPASNNLSIRYRFEGNANASVAIRDIIGRTVYTKDLGRGLSGKEEVKLDINGLSNGIYVLELTHGSNKALSKFTVQK